MMAASNSSISPDLGVQILKAVFGEAPRPSERQLAKRFGVSASAIHRFLASQKVVSKQAKHLSTTEGVKAELVAAALPDAVGEVKALTRDLPITKMCKIMEEAETQYIKHKDLDPHLAGAYLDQMRKCAIEMAKWLGIDNGALAQKELTMQDTLSQMTDEEVEQRAREILAKRQRC